MSITWQMSSSNPDNTGNLALIRDWWAAQNGKEVVWKPRQLPPGITDASQLDWEPQRFDEVFLLKQPELRGITLYWRKADVAQERSTTPQKLELDQLRQQLYMFPQSQPELVIRVGLPELVFQKIKLERSQWHYDADSHVLTLRDDRQLLEVTIGLSTEEWQQLKEQL